VASSLKILAGEKKAMSIEHFLLTKHHFPSKFDLLFKVRSFSKITANWSKQNGSHQQQQSPFEIVDQNQQELICCRREFINRIVDLLQEALNDRLNLVKVMIIHEDNIESFPGRMDAEEDLLIGLQLKSSWRQAVVKGPIPIHEKEKRRFEWIWGERVQLRKFSDGVIQLSTYWPHPNENPIEMMHKMVGYLLQRHLNIDQSSITLFARNYIIWYISQLSKEKNSSQR